MEIVFMASTAPASSSPLSIAIVGVGKIGSTFAFQLAWAGHDVTVVARPGSKRLRQLQRDKAIVSISGEREAVGVSDMLDEDAAYDLVVVTTIGHQVDAVLPALQRSKAAHILFMFNTFDPERLGNAVGAERASFGMPMVVASLNDEGHLRSTISASRKTVHGDRRWAKLFDDSGVPSMFEEDMPGWLRCQAAVCIAMEAISIAAVRRGGGASWLEAGMVANGLQAVFRIIKGLGYSVFPRSKAMMSSAPTPMVAGMLWLVSRVPPIRNAMSNGLDECRALIDEIVKVAKADPRDVPASAVAAVSAIKPERQI